MRPSWRRAPRVDLAAAASTVDRLAVLLDAGIAPPSAWTHVARSGGVAAAVASGAPVGHELAARLVSAASSAPAEESIAWRSVAAAWRVATEAGAPLSPALRELAATLRALAQTARDVEVARAGPVATARVVLLLPLVGIGLAALIGVDALGTLFTTPPGWVCLVAGGALIACGVRWIGRMVRAASRLDPTPGLGLDLLAIALRGGAGVDRAAGLVDAALDDVDLEAARRGAVEQGAEVLAFSRAAGVPAAALLRAEAEELRRIARADAASRAARLETRLLAPLGLCVLPAFVLLGVAPVLLALLSSTAAVL
ncbi:type II secretion system F family protein [Pseudolysinimonas sp.]|uniref:type II secretion system F family protein n=1 Tax=Pseudolysinimonas sp. TaxID=2680009 RepID=UPI003F7E5DA3